MVQLEQLVLLDRRELPGLLAAPVHLGQLVKLVLLAHKDQLARQVLQASLDLPVPVGPQVLRVQVVEPGQQAALEFWVPLVRVDQ